jgi:hypothetical protein
MIHGAKLSLPPATLHIASAEVDHAFGSLGSALIVSWRTHIALDAVKSLVEYRDGLGIARRLSAAIHIAEENVVLPNAEARAAAERGVTDSAYRAPVCALVVLGTGFGASAVRSIGTAIFALRRGPPTRMFADVNAGAEWLLRNADPGLTLRQLLAACEQMRNAGR